jgi:hypothetical protein
MNERIQKLKTYRVERVDVSWCEVEAESDEAALEEANANPDWWCYETGDPTAEVTE